MSADEKQHVLDLIKIKKDRLHVLERQSAAYGLACPPHIQVELDQVKKEIAEHEQQIKESQHARKAVGTAPEEAIDASPGDSEIAYLDLEIEVGLGDGREYPLKVIQSPVGHAAGIMQFPFDKLTLENRLQALQILLLRASGKRRTISSSDEQAVQSFGRDLFDALIIGEIRTCYDKSMQVAAGQGRGIRLKLHVQAPNLATLPWEFLYDPRQAEYVCLSPNNRQISGVRSAIH